MILDRYQVGDPVCGHVAGFKSKVEAMGSALRHICPDTTVYDIMAKLYAPHEWDHRGIVLCWRGYRQCRH